MTRWAVSFVIAFVWGVSCCAFGDALELIGAAVTPHVQADTMRYRVDPEPAAGARVQLFLKAAARGAPLPMYSGLRVEVDGQSPAELLAAGAWAWHDFPPVAAAESHPLPADALTVWTFNGRTPAYGPGGAPALRIGPEPSPWLDRAIEIRAPEVWISAVTFLAPADAIAPDTAVIHLANASKRTLTMRACRFWLPSDPGVPRVLRAQAALAPVPFNGHAAIPPGDKGGFVVHTGPLPLTYAAIEVTLADDDGGTQTVWAHLRIKPERFDISGGWVNGGNALAHEAFLKTLARLHINTAHIAHTPGYSDTDRAARYPLKYFNALTPVEQYDTDEMLPRIHAVEFLGEPQYGGGRPVPPQEVWEKLRPYAVTRLATTVTHSEERIWRDYAGLSDFPHYDAYRVSAPAADAWSRYTRWGDERIAWGAPLETIGDMSRSLRELNRPMPCAVWSQGPHAGWGVYGGRQRTSPTPDEIRMQAYHAISTRITSLYWFNLSLESLVKWRDTLDELARIGRELRMIDALMLEGDAYQFERRTTRRGEPDWDLASVCGPRAALLFALDLAYAPDPDEKNFRFGPPRPARWRFPLPAYLKDVADVFRVDADGITPAEWTMRSGAITIEAAANRAALFVATPEPGLREQIEQRRTALIAAERALDFDPIARDADFQSLAALAEALR